MAKMKVYGISDKAMGLSSPRTMFFISLEPVKVLSAKYGRPGISKDRSILTNTICSNFEGSGWVNDLFLPFLWWFEEWMMAQMKVHGISDKVMGLSSPRTMFFISLEPVKVFCQIWQTRFFKVQKDAAFQGLKLKVKYWTDPGPHVIEGHFMD